MESLQSLKCTLCDPRSAVAQALSAMEPGIDFLLKPDFFRAPALGDLVTWGEWSNVNTENPAVDEITYQVSLRAGDMDRLRLLCNAVNAAMTGLGLLRSYASPDGYAADGGYLTKTYRFSRCIDKRTLRWVNGG